MSSHKLFFIGIQLLFLSHMANTFILLTANMEDVKRIAQKFVSESLAEKIAEFVAKATEQMVANVSHENEQNADDVRDLSEEHNSLQQISRQGEEITTKKALETSKHVEYERDTTTDKYKTQNIDWDKEINELFAVNEDNDIYSKEVKPQVNNEQIKEKNDHDQEVDYDQNADYDQQRADYEQSKIDDKKKIEEQRKQDYEEQKQIYEQQVKQHDLTTDNGKTDPKRKPTNQHDKTQTKKRIHLKIRKPHSNQKPKVQSRTTRKIIDSTILYEHNNILREGVNHRLSSFDTEDTKSKSTFRGFNMQRELTTEKSRIEFDQYDNPNYPKAEFIATSGPVVLPRVAMAKPWWEKEMTV